MMAQEVKKVELDPSKVKGRLVYHTVKRGFDILASGVAMVLLSPLFGVLTVKIKKEDGGPAFYSQTRIGKNGKPFKMWKFRSMIVNADKMVKQLEEQNEIDGAMFKIKDDPRVTKIGHVIRKYSLDELPQLWNVLKGDMSLVGPRPPLPMEVADYTPYDKLRLTVIPGCTGLWQVTKRNDADFDEMVELDLEYINNSSLWFDFKILLKTVGVVVHPNSAY
ncbi:sugar transferase [Lactobacillus taiwanensis]|uniref:sugar transferase n=1 Tax=Lactobacillus taiwanensis TaxID=508451 RepID=UPI000B985083|nr:sugar transferase [Lactobacillus taiwanensis]OYR97353.1 multidrug MFS transporter [Lactobacillus taiwanensis]OYS01864.1 multidrug MFS transporter [Lactobacillus taiwanensis]OYS15793.1 multidrug MFS transporter [Lactobacillus taiwanensis]OYS32165.1 multidrug MFS transporter [Lactobacillus taiwanensis]OYS33389.1 multidrug MFS transporter [Lactobacillus taiwanensis]